MNLQRNRVIRILIKEYEHFTDALHRNLARSFPCLEPKIRRWNPVQFDPDEFYSMACRWSSTERYAAHFVLTVWNRGAAKEKGWAFNIVDAASFLDSLNRVPILRWIDRPYYP